MREIEEKLQRKNAQDFYEVLASFNEPKEVAAFLRDVLTFEEMDEAIRRFEVARLLSEGMTVREIAKQTKMSSTTVSRINYWLHHGMGGYGKALEKLKV